MRKRAEAAKTRAGERIVWFSEKLDIALVRCLSPCGDVPAAWDLFAHESPAPRSRCHCAGYLSNLHDAAGHQRRKTPNGTFGTFSKDEVGTDLNGLDVQLEDDELWQGFSGSAVFAGNRLAALVRAVNTGESGRGLTVSFVASALGAEGDGPGQGLLRDVPGFLVPPGSEPCWERLCPYVIRVLNEQPAVRASIEAEQPILLDVESKAAEASASCS